MSFACLTQPAIEPLIERFGAARDVTLVVGAGASMEAGLPSWRDLIERLLGRVAGADPRLGTRAHEQQWVEHVLAQEDLLAAGAIVEALATDELAELLPEELYGEQGPDQLEPGPIAREIARLRLLFGERLVLLTTNYDDLIERALIQSGITARDVKSYVRRHNAPAGTCRSRIFTASPAEQALPDASCSPRSTTTACNAARRGRSNSSPSSSPTPSACSSARR